MLYCSFREFDWIGPELVELIDVLLCDEGLIWRFHA
jgi:hypothetical protein